MNHSTDRDDLQEAAALYVSGAMSEDEREQFEERLESDARCRGAVAELEQVAAELVRNIEPVQPAASVLERLLAEVSAEGSIPDPSGAGTSEPASVSELPVYLLRKDEGKWVETGAPGCQMRQLFVDEAADRITVLYRMEPGSTYPRHRHHGPEECLVLEGSIRAGDITLAKGDYQRVEAESVHLDTHSEEGALLLISSSMRDEVF